MEGRWEEGRRRRRRRRLQQKKSFLRHHTAGLGDGKFREGAGGRGAERKPPALPRPMTDGPGHGGRNYVRTRQGRTQQQQLSPFDPPDVLDRAVANGDEGVVPYVPPGNRYGDYAFGGTTPKAAAATADDGPWQLSVLALLGIIAILVALFLHLISDPQSSAGTGKARPHYHPRRTRRQQARSVSFQTKKKKNDELSEDDFVSDVDGSYQADSEAQWAGNGGSSSSAPRGVVSQAPLYYPIDYKPPQQQHRQRKQAGLGAAAGAGVGGSSSAVQKSPKPTAAHTVIDSHPYYHRTTSQAGAGPRIYGATGGCSQDFSPGGTRLPAAAAAKTVAAAAAPPRIFDGATTTGDASGHRCEPGLGTGLEGFDSSARPPLPSSADVGGTAVPAPPPRRRGSGDAAGASATRIVPRMAGGPSGGGRTTVSNADVGDNGGTVLQRMGTSSPFQSFDSLPGEISQEPSTLRGSMPQETTPGNGSGEDERLGKSSPRGMLAAPSVQDAFASDYSPPGLRNRRGGDERTRPSVAILSGSCDHDFTPRIDNVKRRVEFPKAAKMHDSDVESASGDLLPPPPLYSSADEDDETEERLSSPQNLVDGDVNAHAAESRALEDERNAERLSPSLEALSPTLPATDDQGTMFRGVQLPLVPDLDHEEKTGSTEISTLDAPHSLAAHDLVRPPRSVTLEELHLIRMESGDFEGSSAKWTVASGSGLSTDQCNEKSSVVQQPATPTLPRPHRVGLIQESKEHPERRKEQKGETLVQLSPTKEKSSIELGVKGPMRCLASPSRNESQRQLMLQIAQKTPLRAGAKDGVEPATPIDHKRPDVTKWSDSAASLTLPIEFSELRLMSVIGGGGFGQVWKAMWRGTPVAVKVLASSAQTDNVPKAVLEEFASEINMVSGMRHPNICLYMGACLEPPNRAIVTEFAAHGSLWDALRSPLDPPYLAADGITRNAWPLNLYHTPAPGPTAGGNQAWYDDSSAPKPSVAPVGAWPWVLVKRVASGAARGMTYLHSGQPPVLHRDLKSANLLLDDSYTTKVADFGLSRIKAQERSMTGNCGTVQWMAPEILANQSYAEPADIYSFGIILWELLTRECPFEGMSPIQCALAVLNENARPETPEWCPPAFAALIKSCVDRNPSARPTFPQILSALDVMP